MIAGSCGLPGLLRQRAAVGFGGRAARNTAVIQIWLGGGPSHIDTYDLKPAAPDQFRGPFKPISTNVPGAQICELLPLQARMMDRLALIRSLHHTTNEHHAATHWAQTGHFGPFGTNLNPTRPSVGSVTARLLGPNQDGMVPYVHIAPDPLGFYSMRNFGPAYLGARYAPMDIEFARVGRHIKAKPEYFGDLTGKVQFDVPNLELLPGMNVAQLNDRAGLMRQLDHLQRNRDRSGAMETWDEYHQQALTLLTSRAARNAFDLSREAPKLRERYGMNAWGQGALLCRRLVEAGVTFVTFNHDSFSVAWDQHNNLEVELKNLLPVYDQMLTALIEDLVDRGLYERVLLLIWGEFGRTPKMGQSTGAGATPAGRDHYGRAGVVLLGGAGLQGGLVVGSTTSKGEEPKDRPVTPGDVLATVYNVLGIDPKHEFHDESGRPLPVLAEGQALWELL